MSGLEAPKPEAVKQQPEAAKQQPEAPNQPEAPKQPEAAKQEAEKVLESKETKAVLDKMKKIEDYINNIPDEELNSYK
jgi:hypothetical protein